MGERPPEQCRSKTKRTRAGESGAVGKLENFLALDPPFPSASAGLEDIVRTIGNYVGIFGEKAIVAPLQLATEGESKLWYNELYRRIARRMDPDVD